MQDGQTNYSFLRCCSVKHKLKTQESLRLAVANWLLTHDKHYICCEGNELGDEFIENFELPELEEELIETFVGKNDEITLAFQSRIYLSARQSVNGKPSSFIIVRYERVLYDDFGNIYRNITLGYNF